MSAIQGRIGRRNNSKDVIAAIGSAANPTTTRVCSHSSHDARSPRRQQMRQPAPRASASIHVMAAIAAVMRARLETSRLADHVQASEPFKYGATRATPEPGAPILRSFDHLGSIVRITTAAGAPEVNRAYDRWGNALAGGLNSGYGFPGESGTLKQLSITTESQHSAVVAGS
jgi:hypothetical protein